MSDVDVEAPKKTYTRLAVLTAERSGVVEVLGRTFNVSPEGELSAQLRFHLDWLVQQHYDHTQTIDGHVRAHNGLLARLAEAEHALEGHGHQRAQAEALPSTPQRLYGAGRHPHEIPAVDDVTMQGNTLQVSEPRYSSAGHGVNGGMAVPPWRVFGSADFQQLPSSPHPGNNAGQHSSGPTAENQPGYDQSSGHTRNGSFLNASMSAGETPLLQSFSRASPTIQDDDEIPGNLEPDYPLVGLATSPRLQPPPGNLYQGQMPMYPGAPDYQMQ